MKLKKIEWILIGVVAVIIITAGFLIANEEKIASEQGIFNKEEAHQEIIKRQACYDKYQTLFKNATDINDPLNYNTTNPELYNCLNKLKDPLGLLDFKIDGDIDLSNTFKDKQ